MGKKRHGRFTLLTLSVLTLGLALAGCTNTGGVIDQQPTKPPQRTLSSADALADFDRMWEIVNTTHFDPDFNGVDWAAVRDELRPQAALAQNRHEIRLIMSDALGRFGQSHFGIIPEAPPEARTPSLDQSPDEADDDNAVRDSESDDVGGNDVETEPTIPDDSAMDGIGDADTGIDVRIIDGQAVVSSIRPNSPAQLAGVKTGWIVKTIRSQDIHEKLVELGETVDEDEIGIYGVSMVTHRLIGPADSTINLSFIDGNNKEVDLDLTRAPMPGEFIKFGNLPPLSTHLEWSRFTATSDSGQQSDIGIIAFNIWMMPIAAKFERAMYELRDVDGLIIDLRGNPGGIGALSSSIGRFLVSEKGSLGTMMMRGTDLKFNIEPVIVTTWGEPIDPFAGPIAILTDSGTASTSEVFAGGLQSLGRVKVFGTRSAGMALPAGMDKLPSGDVLLHAIANFVTSTGYQLEHGGVIPDTEVKLTRANLLNGVDAPKQAAIEWIERSNAE